jgi:hypothetical protein
VQTAGITACDDIKLKTCCLQTCQVIAPLIARRIIVSQHKKNLQEGIGEIT